MCFFKVKHYFGHISAMFGLIDVKQKGSVRSSLIARLIPKMIPGRHRTGSTLAKVITCFQMVTSHNLNLCELLSLVMSSAILLWGIHKRYLSHWLLKLAWNLNIWYLIPIALGPMSYNIFHEYIFLEKWQAYLSLPQWVKCQDACHICHSLEDYNFPFRINKTHH